MALRTFCTISLVFFISFKVTSAVSPIIFEDNILIKSVSVSLVNVSYISLVTLPPLATKSAWPSTVSVIVLPNLFKSSTTQLIVDNTSSLLLKFNLFACIISIATASISSFAFTNSLRNSTIPSSITLGSDNTSTIGLVNFGCTPNRFSITTPQSSAVAAIPVGDIAWPAALCLTISLTRAVIAFKTSPAISSPVDGTNKLVHLTLAPWPRILLISSPASLNAITICSASSRFCITLLKPSHPVTISSSASSANLFALLTKYVPAVMSVNSSKGTALRIKLGSLKLLGFVSNSVNSV